MIPNFEPYLSGAPKGHGVEPPGLDLKVVAELPSGRRMALDLEIKTDMATWHVRDVVGDLRRDVAKRVDASEAYGAADVAVLAPGGREDGGDFEPYHKFAPVGDTLAKLPKGATLTLCVVDAAEPDADLPPADASDDPEPAPDGWEGWRARGNAAFAKRDFDGARACYDRALEDPAPLALERATLHSNRAAAQLERRAFAEAVGDCGAALKALGGGVGVSASPDERRIRDKIRYRRALGHLALGAATKAKIDHATFAKTCKWADLEARAKALAAAPRRPWPELKNWEPPPPPPTTAAAQKPAAAPRAPTAAERVAALKLKRAGARAPPKPLVYDEAARAEAEAAAIAAAERWLATARARPPAPPLDVGAWVGDGAVAAALAAGRLVRVEAAFADGAARALRDGLAALPDVCWSLHRRCAPGFQYRHHNLYARAPLFERACPAYVRAADWFQRQGAAWFRRVTGEDGRVIVSASWYRSGDYSAPHSDAGGGRHVAFVWHLSEDWDAAWGGDLVWCAPFATMPATFNTLYLFKVSDASHHFVSPVTEYAAGRRLAVNGWFVVDDARERALLDAANADHAARVVDDLSGAAPYVHAATLEQE